jgi:predicted DNA-binding transcriptional regulator AlpA
MPKKKISSDKVDLPEATTRGDASTLDDRFVTLKEVEVMVGLSGNTIRRRMGAGTFPIWQDRGDAGVWLISVIREHMRSRPPRPFKVPGKPNK